MSHIAISQTKIKRRERSAFVIRVLNWCICLPRLPGYFPMGLGRSPIEDFHR